MLVLQRFDSNRPREAKEHRGIRDNECIRNMKLSTSMPLLPPLSPPKSGRSRKKSVYFADAIGLELTSVKVVEKLADFNSCSILDEKIEKKRMIKSRLIANFENIVDRDSLRSRLQSQNVCLERVECHCSDEYEDYSDENRSFKGVRGVVRVRNLGFHKSVYVRYSFDKWNNMHEERARFVGTNMHEDVFVFHVKLAHPADLELAVRFHCVGQQFWDNNQGKNYGFSVEKII